MDILIVDSDTGIRDYYRSILSSEFRGIALDFESTAQRAKEKIIQKSFDLIITETMIEGEIFDFLLFLRSNYLPFIIITSEQSQRLIVECMRMGALDFLSKNKIKTGIFPQIIVRALLEADRWQHLIQAEEEIPHRPEYLKTNEQLISFLTEERKEMARHSMNEGLLTTKFLEPVEGAAVHIIYVYARLIIPDSYLAVFDEPKMTALKMNLLTQITGVSEKYGAHLWVTKEDSCLFAFYDESYMQAVLSAINMRAAFQLYTITSFPEGESPRLNIGMAAGQTLYRMNKTEIYSEALNLSAHMAIYGNKSHFIMITEEIYRSIGPRAQKYFFLSDPFENQNVYSFELIA